MPLLAFLAMWATAQGRDLLAAPLTGSESSAAVEPQRPGASDRAAFAAPPVALPRFRAERAARHGGRQVPPGPPRHDLEVDQNGYTPLILAAQRNDLAAVKSLLASGANPDQRTSSKATALYQAVVASCQPRLVQELLDAGATPDAEIVDFVSGREDPQCIDVFGLLRRAGARSPGSDEWEAGLANRAARASTVNIVFGVLAGVAGLTAAIGLPALYCWLRGAPSDPADAAPPPPPAAPAVPPRPHPPDASSELEPFLEALALPPPGMPAPETDEQKATEAVEAAARRKAAETVAAALSCSISTFPFSGNPEHPGFPVLDGPQGHSFSKAWLERWRDQTAPNSTNPLTRAELEVVVTPNAALAKAIQAITKTFAEPTGTALSALQAGYRALPPQGTFGSNRNLAAFEAAARQFPDFVIGAAPSGDSPRPLASAAPLPAMPSLGPGPGTPPGSPRGIPLAVPSLLSKGPHTVIHVRPAPNVASAAPG